MAILTSEVLTRIAPHKDKFLAVHPVPLNEDGSPKYTDLEWINEYVKRHLIGQIKRGEEVLNKQQFVATDVLLED